MEKIDIKDFEKLNLRIGQVKAVKQHPTLQDYILLINLGPAERDMQIVADLKESYTQEDLMGKQVVFLENLLPVKVGGVESQGLLLITHKDKKPVLLQPEKEVCAGVKIAGLRDTEATHYTEIGK